MKVPYQVSSLFFILTLTIIEILSYLLDVFKIPNWSKITNAFNYYCQDINEINSLLIMERRLICHMIPILWEQMKRMDKDK